MHRSYVQPRQPSIALAVCLRVGALLVFSCLMAAGLLVWLNTAERSEKALAEDELVTFYDVTDLVAPNPGSLSPQYGGAWGDYDNDGYDDLYVGNHFNPSNLYHNYGNGSFSDVGGTSGIYNTPGDWHGAAWGDYNNDGALDLYVVTGRAIVGGSDLYVNYGNGVFVDRAAEAGVTNEDGRGRVPRWIDYDKDGDLDIFIANDASTIAPNVLYRNNGNGTFTDVAAAAGIAVDTGAYGLAPADYDNDGYTDFILTKVLNDAKGEKLFRNRRDGTFEETTASAGLGNHWPDAAAWGDYDNDGDLDLYLCRSYEDFRDKLEWTTRTITTVVWTGYGVHTEGISFTAGASSVTFDLWQADRRNYAYEIEFGESRQHPPSVPFTLSADANCSGDPSGTPTQDVLIYCNPSTGVWTVRWTGDNERFVGVIRTSGNITAVTPDGLTTSWTPPSRPNVLYRNKGDGTFAQYESFAGVADPSNSYDAQWIDFDNDRDLDLYVTNFGDTHIGNQINRLYQNNGDGTFDEVTAAVGLAFVNPGNDKCSAWADYDNDGFLDLYLANSTYSGYLSGPHKLYRNGGNANHWLKIKLHGGPSNSLGIGAKVRVTTGGRSQYREIGVASSTPCHNSLIAHFGLGQASLADAITVTWPSGYVQVLHDVAADQALHVAETGLADLSVTKTRASTEDVTAGDSVTYTFNISNQGSAAPVTANLVDTFSDPAALAGVDGPGCSWTAGSATVNCTLSGLQDNTARPLNLIVVTNEAYSGTLVNTATVAPLGDMLDPALLDNESGPVAVTIKAKDDGPADEFGVYLPLILR